VSGAVEASFAGRDLAATTRPQLVAAVFAERWDGCAAATWNTRRAARASEVLALDVEDLDRPRRRARIRSKGGSTDMILWAAPTARLLTNRTTGPIFLTRYRSRTEPAVRDLYQPTGQARLTTVPPRRSSADIRVGGPSTSCATHPSRI